MKKITKKLKGKKVLSIVLAVIMLATTFNIALPQLKLDASAAGSITTNNETVTQTKIVNEDTRKTTYDNYASQFLNGASTPTNMVIPGLSNAEDYVVQGMAYYPAKDWMLITAYHGDSDETGTVKPSKVFALDAATGEFVAMFSFLNPPDNNGNRTPNTEHGGGIAISEHNLYYACGDDDREIAYAPLSELELAEGQTYKEIKLAASADFNEVGSVEYEGKTGYTAYVCVDNGVLWTGNFFDEGVKLVGGMDFTEIANGYNAPANNDYNSMVFGYRLTGNSPEDEWNYLMGTVNGKDCRGNPSYVIGLNNKIKDVQYAVVDNGKLYLSCSYGTGEGTLSVSYAGMNPYSSLIIADIDLSQPGTRSTNIQTHNGTLLVKAYDIQDYKKFDMMPMSEGLCVVNDNIFVTFESASYKYREKAGIMGNCGYPVDVVWQLDPYELMETTVAEPEKSIYYEKVNSLKDIVDGEEYIIVHESNEKDSVSQKNYLYALNAKGNFKGLELSKSTPTNIKGYDGMIGHPISYYSFEKGLNDQEILYLGDPEKDDIENIRWTISKNGDGKYNIKNTSTYFANCDNFYFNENKITMAPNGADYLANIGITQIEENSGYFYMRNTTGDKEYYLWCNDGFENYNGKAEAYYANNKATYPLLDGITEKSGTFHCDALNVSGDNILGGQINVSDDRAFQIYRRVIDGVSSTYESRVYTDLKAELQEDGTYTVTLETFAISPNHYQYVGERPTDYIIVADTSKSMGASGSTGYIEFPDGDLAVDKLSLETDTEDDRGQGIVGYGFSNEDIYFKHEADGKFYKAYMAIRNEGHYKTNILGNQQWVFDKQFYYVYYIADDGFYYCYTNQNKDPKLKYTEEQFKAWVAGGDGQALQTASSERSKNDPIVGDGRRDEILLWGTHYRFDDINSTKTGEHVRLDTLKNAAKDLVGDIAAQNSGNRIALVQHGGNTSGIYADGTWGASANAAFLNATNVATIEAAINGLSAGKNDNDVTAGMNFVNQLIDSNISEYGKKDDTGRNVAVIFFSDGIPAASDTTSAANNAIAAALTVKNKGAFIYSVLIGNNSASGFNKKSYMDAISSKYADAESMTSLGGQSVDGINYAISLATTTMNNYLNFGQIATKEVRHNASVSLENLDAGAYLREQLSDAFKFPKDGKYSVSVNLITGEYDEIGRFSFRDSQKEIDANATDAGKISVATNEENKTITVTNYDYSEEYIAKNRANPGRKLRVEITGLLADETAQIQNTSISNTDTTAIYKTEDDMNNSTVEKDLSFKKLPTQYFNIPEYTYVLDYGLDLLDTEVNGTLKSVSSDLSAQRDADGNLSYKDVSENGLVKIQEGDQNLIYHTTPTNTTDSGYVLIQRDNGKYDWFEIKVVPASNVYFEETEFAKDAGTGTVAWEKTTGGTSAPYRDLPGENDTVGYDAAYDNTNTYSNGTALSATVDSTNKRSKTATVSFKGNGIDIISACGPTTGMQIINIKNAQGKSVAASIVDTYYQDDTFTQVPVFSWRGNADPDEIYTVETTAVYLSTAGALKKSGFKSSLIDTGLVMNTADDLNTPNVQAMLDAAGVEDIDAENLELVWFDDNSVLNGGTGVAPTKKGARAGETSSVTLNNYIDGFRIYNPLGSNYSTDYEASEQGSMYYNVIDNLADGTFTPEGSLNGTVAFVTGELAEGETLSFSNYESIGPKNELYLNANATNGVTFKTPFVDGVKVMVSLRAVNGATTVNINGTEFAIKSATEMYYDITDLLVAEDGKATVSITNSGSGILAVNNIKLTNTVSGASLMPLSAEDIEAVQHYATMEPVQATVENGVVTPVVEEEIPGENTNNDTDTETEEFSIFSFVEMLIAFIEKILSSSFGTGNIF